MGSLTKTELTIRVDTSFLLMQFLGSREQPKLKKYPILLLFNKVAAVTISIFGQIDPQTCYLSSVVIICTTYVVFQDSPDLWNNQTLLHTNLRTIL